MNNIKDPEISIYACAAGMLDSDGTPKYLGTGITVEINGFVDVESPTTENVIAWLLDTITHSELVQVDLT